MEAISFSQYPELWNHNLKIKDIKRIIKEKTGIIEENQIFYVYSDRSYYHDNESFWNIFDVKIFDKSKYKTYLKRNIYVKEVILDLTKEINELKQMVYKQTNIPIDRQQFYVNDELKSDFPLTTDFHLVSKISIKISKQQYDNLYIKYPNSEIKNLKVDLCNTVLRILYNNI